MERVSLELFVHTRAHHVFTVEYADQ